MASTCSPSPAVICAESIALLYLLHSVPLQPSSNETDQLLVRQSGYVLSFARERSLASILAFLSNTKEDPNHIPALCIKENPQSASMNVMLAVNRRTYEDGNQALQDLKQNFENLFAVLSETMKDNTQSQEHRIFTAVVSMCSPRILCRLRLVAGKRKVPRQPIKDILEEVVRYFRQLDNERLDRLPVALFVGRAKDVMKLADSWVKHQTQPKLEDLIEGIYRLKQVGRLQALLDMIPNRTMCPSSRQNLINIVSKVSRYREAAQFLYRAARKYPMVRRMTAVIVNLPREAFYRLSDGNYTPRLESTVARSNTLCHGPQFDYLCRLLNTTNPQLSDQFTLQTEKTLKESKVHAEIQLILYYEMNASELPPRVVCSSKDSCYLCNAFIMMHGKMHTPRSHGRLYPGWRLPLIPDFSDLNTRFNSVLESLIGDSLKNILSKHTRIVYPDPNESTLLSLPLSTSTLRTLVLSEATREERKSIQSHLVNNTVGSRNQSTSSKVRTTLSLKDGSSCSSALNPKVSMIIAERDSPTIGLSDWIATQALSGDVHLPGTDSLQDTTAFDLELAQDTLRQDSIVIARESKSYSAGPLEISIEYAADAKSDISRNSLKAFYSIKWLSIEEANELLGCKTASVVDVEALRDQDIVSLAIDNQKGLLMMARGALVRIIPQFGP